MGSGRNRTWIRLGLCSVLICSVFSVSISADTDSAYPEKTVYSSHINIENKIALTFDDGPHPRYTPMILDILAEYHIPATFFMIGENAERYPELVERIQKEGHEIGNHTYLHKNLQQSTEEEIRTQILHTENILLPLLDSRPKLLRPPGGLYNEAVCDAARTLDYDIILWTLDTHDWKHTPADVIIQYVKDNIACGDIILCHDFIGGTSSPTPDVLRELIPYLLQEEYHFVTVSELIHSR